MDYGIWNGEFLGLGLQILGFWAFERFEMREGSEGKEIISVQCPAKWFKNSNGFGLTGLKTPPGKESDALHIRPYKTTYFFPMKLCIL